VYSIPMNSRPSFRSRSLTLAAQYLTVSRQRIPTARLLCVFCQDEKMTSDVLINSRRPNAKLSGFLIASWMLEGGLCYARI
jgi:hypothetical protein